ncbi:hypothetical protein BJX64DRAFT_290048 [Aspergillus heterothallicus]
MKPQDRLYSEGQGYLGPRENPTTETHCNFWDWDRLKMIKVKGSAKIFPPDEDVEVPILAQFAGCLSPEVRAVTVDDDGLLTGVSTDPEEDDTPFVAYLPFSIARSLAGCRTIRLPNLDRLGPGYEINLLKILPSHPNIVPFDRVVLEDVESRIIGFTTKYIPGGTLDSANVPFRFEFLQQLTQLVDFLNLELGIMRQDIAPRKLLIDPDTNKILLFDFDWAACGMKRLLNDRNDVTGVAFTLYFTLYELITRKPDEDLKQYFSAANRLTWPDLLTAPDYNVPFELGRPSKGEPIWTMGPLFRRTAMEKGQYCFRWERPSQNNMLNKI